MCYASFNVYALYCLHLSHHQLSVLSKPLLAKLCAKRNFACTSIPRNQYLPYESIIPSYPWYFPTTSKVYNLCAIFRWSKSSVCASDSDHEEVVGNS